MSPGRRAAALAVWAALQLAVPAHARGRGDVDEPAPAATPGPAGTQVLRDLPYGADRRQRMDVYLPAQARPGSPVIFMVHGGAWRYGDKSASAVVGNKVERWVRRGVVFVSVGYRLLPEADPLQQADDVARALAEAQRRAVQWGGDPTRFVLMGHSAGAHLVALLSASPARARALGARPWLGTVALDSAALDVPRIMRARHLPLYDAAFGRDADRWRELSPVDVLAADAPPMLLVCSLPRATSCAQARSFAERAGQAGVRAETLGQDLSHGEINAQLGVAGAYTDAVEAFLRSLDPALAAALPAH